MPNPAPGTVVSVGSLVTPGGPPGVQGLTGLTGSTGPIGPASLGAFVLLSAAYTVVAGDSGKYFICSGGSWTLTLPAPQSGFLIAVRNDMGITGVTGSITLSPTGGALIDGASSLAILAGQECLLMCNGTNWRSFGRQRNVVVGARDVANVASDTILLPPDYRFFRLEFNAVALPGSGNLLYGQVSADGGSTWYTTNYYGQYNYNNTVSGMVSGFINNIAEFYLTNWQYSSPGVPGCSDLILQPGDTVNACGISGTSGGYYSGFGGYVCWQIFEYLNVLPGRMNALKYFSSSGNITQSKLTVIGVV